MPRATQAPEIEPTSRLAVMVAMVGGTAAAAVLAIAGVLWLRYGTEVFFQTLAAGLAACF